VKIQSIKNSLCLAALAVFLSACGLEQEQPDSAALLLRAQTLLPADPALAEIYSRSCVSCHAAPASVAPLTGDHQSWQPRMAKGMDNLLGSVINGFGGMPPLGLCMDCDTEQFESLIAFMAQAK